MADAVQFAKVKAIVEADDARRVIVVSAPGKRYKDDHKVTDLLYLCSAHLKYGVSCEKIFALIRQRYQQIADDCGLSLDLAAEFDALWQRMCSGEADEEYLASRGEYFAARLMAEYLGYTFLDAALWLRFKFDGTVDQEASYEALRKAADGQRVVIPGFYGAMPDGRVVTLTRGGSDITGALAAAALDADVYENWTDVSGILMADPRIVENPRPIPRITYAELREMAFMGASVLHEESILPVKEKGIALNIRNTNRPDDPGTLIPVIHTAEAHALITSGVICGGMLPKVTCCMDAIRWGVHRVFIIDGRVPHAILIEMLTNEGIGTMFVAGQGGNANEYTAT